MAASSSSAATVKPSDHSSPAEETEEETEFCRGFKDADAFVKHGLGAVVAATKASAALPAAGDEFDLYRSFPAFQQFCASQGDRLLHCMSQIMQHHGCRSHMRDRNRLTGLEDRFDLVVDSNDAVLEKVGILLDEASGVSRTQQPVMPAGYQPPKIVVKSLEETFHLLHAKNIQRPQLKFKDKVDNSNTPFVSKIFIKPNAVKPLPSCECVKKPALLASYFLSVFHYHCGLFSHPYQYELDHVVMPESLKCKPEVQMYKPLAESTCQFINTLDDLVALNEKLAKVSEFAVDLEHHSYRSFLGITCLMQISTREEDFLIDTLELRSEMYILNETFTDPAIMKVFHGADSDIEWLQKDFGLYVVNMFDTHHAARCLNLGRNSLDHLLKVYCSVNSDKRYQLADWRIRPLPDEMLKYAQADTHYLLYVYDRVRADLYDTGNSQPTLIQQVWAKSRDLSLKKYVKPIFTEDSYMELYRKQKKSFNTQQLAAFRLLYAWRDKLGRENDESTGYVLPNHMMMKIAEELPKEPQGIIACCNPTPALVRQQINELHQLLKQARETPLLKTEVLAEKRKSMTPKRKPQPTSFGPHDISRSSESDFLDLSSFETPIKPGVLFSEEEDESVNPEEKSLHGLIASAKISLFADVMSAAPAHLTVAQQKAHSIMGSFENPFRMYLPSKDIHISKNAKYDPSSKIYEIRNRWKLQSVEQQQKEAQEKRQAKEQAKKAQEKRKKAKLSYQESLQNVHTVRQQVMEAKQAGQKRERAASDVGEESLKPNVKVSKTESETSVADQSTKPAQKKQNVQEPEVPEQDFKPFDYSQSNFKIFAGKSKESSQFDPNRQAHGPKQKKNQKGQKKSAVGGRSMSYVPAKSDRGIRPNWPKR
uniref:Exosome complex component 10 n=1 Tax=Sinocyclocheilus rhinocerous TaxID=307959 RepID=A0A673JZF8_9TELE